MSFQQFLSNWRYRRRLSAEFERFQNIQPPKNPSRRYMDRLVRKLCRIQTAWSARKELAMIGPPAVPSLLAGLQRPDAKQKFELGGYFIPFDEMIELLVPHAPDDVEQVLLPLVDSSSDDERKCAAFNLARLGRTALIPALNRLLDDEDGYVRRSVVSGIGWAISEERADPQFQSAAYEALLLHCFDDWPFPVTNHIPSTLVRLNPDRATADLVKPQNIRLDHPSFPEILKGLNDGEIHIPERLIRSVFNQAQQRALESEEWSDQRIAAESLEALSRTLGDALRPLLEQLLDSPNIELAESAADMLARLAGVENAQNFVNDRLAEDGFDALTQPQQYHYCVSDFSRSNDLMDYLGNIGTYIPETVDALHAIGVDDAANALAEAMRLIGPISRERDRELRLTAFEGRYEHIEAALEPLEESCKPTIRQLPIKIRLYAIRHAEHFRPADAHPQSNTT